MREGGGWVGRARAGGRLFGACGHVGLGQGLESGDDELSVVGYYMLVPSATKGKGARMLKQYESKAIPLNMPAIQGPRER